MGIFKYHIVPGRFTRSSIAVRNQVNGLIAEFKPDAQFFTELSDFKRANAIEHEGYFTIHSIEDKGAAECAINVHNSYEILTWDTEVLTKKKFFSKTGKERALVNGLYAVIQHHSGMFPPIVISIAHMPSNIEHRRGFSDTVNRVIAFQEASRAWRKLMRKVRLAHRTKNVLVTADWNLDIKKQWVRRFLKSIWTMYRFTFRRPYPPVGDIGKRLISYGMYRGLKWSEQPFLLEKHRASDHRTVVGELKVLVDKKRFK